MDNQLPRTLRIDPQQPAAACRQTNSVKQLLRDGKTAIGSEISRFRSPEVVRVYAQAGLDFVFIDMEHTCFSLETVADMIAVARGSGICPIVRVPQAEYSFVSRVLDSGAQGIIVPRVNTPDQVRQIVSWMRYPPYGIRGYACTANQTDGRAVEPEQFMSGVHQETLLVIQIERVEAMRNLAEMLAVDGVDVACLGYMDLSVDMGLPGQLEHPSVAENVQKIIDVAEANGLAAGIICPDMTAVTHWAKRGMRFVSYASEAILLERAAQEAADQLRQATATPADELPFRSTKAAPLRKAAT